MRASFSPSKSRRQQRMQVELLEDRQLLSTITVNTTADDTTPDATLSLREAIEVSNGTLPVSSLSTPEQAQVSGAVGATNTIDFNIPTTDPGYNPATGVWTIAPLSGLPSITTNAAIINGYSQPGSSKNTLAHGDNAKLTIAINGGLKGFDGLTLGQQGSQVSGLDIAKFQNGVVITAAGNVQVEGCFIGTDPTGEAAAPNAVGVEIENSSNTIGGPDVGDRNVISGNNGIDGILVPDQFSNPLGITPTGNLIENNFIGLDATGTKALGNSDAGVSDDGSGDTYGGTAAGVGNVISGNGEVGLESNNSITIEGNYVGTDATGNVALGNGPTQSGGSGIVNLEYGHLTSITTIISNNVVSGNDDGISVFMASGSQSAYTIANNLIGTNAAGTAPLGNSGTGLTLNSVDNVTVQNNVISANYAGVLLATAAPVSELQHVEFLGNLIGTDKTGTVALGNKGIGISIDPGSGITIGGTGPGQGNVIAYNLFGIDLVRGQQDEFIRNSIFGNTGSPGYPPPGILPESGANQSVAAPALTFTPGTGSTGTLSGTLTEAPNTTYVVEAFSNPSAQALAQAQGETFLQDVTLKTDGTGKASFSLPEPNSFYTATATDPSGDTSAFSIAVGLQTLSATTTTVSSSQNPSTVGQQVTFTAVVTAPSYQGTPTGTVTFTIDGQAHTPVSLSVVGGKHEAQFVTSTLTAGPHTVTAAYSGDAHVSPSTGSLPTQTVSAANLQVTTTTLTSSLDPSTVGQQVAFTAVVSPGASAGTPTGSVTFTVDGTPESPVPLQVVKGSDQAAFSIATLGAGPHTITATYNGDTTFAASTVAGPFVQTVTPGTDGPTVKSLQRFGIHMQPTVLVLSFNDGLDPLSAQDLSNYRIVGPAGRSIGISSAEYDPTTNTVTLRPGTRIDLHDTYQFTVIGTGPKGVTNSQGILLDGTDSGQPGSNYTATLTWRNVVWTPAEARKYAHAKASKPAGALSHSFLLRSR